MGHGGQSKQEKMDTKSTPVTMLLRQTARREANPFAKEYTSQINAALTGVVNSLTTLSLSLSL